MPAVYPLINRALELARPEPVHKTTGHNFFKLPVGDIFSVFDNNKGVRNFH